MEARGSGGWGEIIFIRTRIDNRTLCPPWSIVHEDRLGVIGQGQDRHLALGRRHFFGERGPLGQDLGHVGADKGR